MWLSCSMGKLLGTNVDKVLGNWKEWSLPDGFNQSTRFHFNENDLDMYECNQNMLKLKQLLLISYAFMIYLIEWEWIDVLVW